MQDKKRVVQSPDAQISNGADTSLNASQQIGLPQQYHDIFFA
jgi:hypothetical protein